MNEYQYPQVLKEEIFFGLLRKYNIYQEKMITRLRLTDGILGDPKRGVGAI